MAWGLWATKGGDIMLSGLVRALAALAILGGATAGLIGGSAPARAAAEFLVNAPSALEQSSPAVARLANGFVAVWRGVIPRPDGLPGLVGVVDGQLFAANGTKVGGEFRVNKKFFGAAYVNLGLPAVAVLADGTFVVVWASDADDDEGWGNIQGQRFSAAGEKIGKEFRINRQATGPQQYRGIAALADGGFVVVWASSPDGTSAISYDIYGQRFSADGERVGPQFRVNRNDDGEEGNPAVAGFPDIAGMPRAVAPGGFVVVWDFDDQNVGPSAIYGQLYAADGSKVGGRFTIDKTDWDLQKPRVAMLADGGFVVIWERNIDFVYNIRAQRYSAEA